MREQAGAVAWRPMLGRVEVLLVTSRSSGRWILPKGEIEGHLGRLGSALEEAWEEGGVRGEGDPRPLGRYPYEKWGRRHEVVLFGVRVTAIHDEWPEAHERSRAWVPLHEAAARVDEPGLASFLETLDPTVLARRPPLAISWLPAELGYGRVPVSPRERSERGAQRGGEPASRNEREPGPLIGRVGVCSLPGERYDSLAEDLDTLCAFGVTHLVSLVEESELGALDPIETAASRARAVREAGLEYLHLPTEDFTAPAPAQIDRAMALASAAVDAGGAVVFHCWAGLGRAGTMLACWLVSRGSSANDAITTTRWTRPGAIQSASQEACIREFAGRLRA